MGTMVRVYRARPASDCVRRCGYRCSQFSPVAFHSFSFFASVQCNRNWLVHFLQSISWNVAHNISLLIVTALDTNNVVYHTENSNYIRNDKWNLAAPRNRIRSMRRGESKTEEEERRRDRGRETKKKNWSTDLSADKIKWIKKNPTTKRNERERDFICAQKFNKFRSDCV